MKKSLLALAVLGAFAASAQAQSTATIYGVMDAGIAITKGNVAGGKTQLQQGSTVPSRFGVKGTEDLGGGLTAIYEIQTGVGIDSTTGRGATTDGTLGNRWAGVGLRGSFGTVQFGRLYNYSYLFTKVLTADPMQDGGVGRSLQLAYPTTVWTNNSIQYQSPSVGGFSGVLMYGLGEVQDGGISNGRTIDLLASYANGPVVVRLGHNALNSFTGTPAVPTLDLETKYTNVAATYDFKVVKAHFGYGKLKQTNDLAAGATTADAVDIIMGVTVPVGKDSIAFSAVAKNDKTAANLDGRMLAVMYKHNMSARTQLYVSAAKMSNKGGVPGVGNVGTYTIQHGTAGTTTTRGDDKGVSMGIRHLF